MFVGAAHGEPASAMGEGPGAPPREADSGIEFICPAERLPRIRQDMARYLAELAIAPALFAVQQDEAAGKLRFTLTTPAADTNTLDLAERPEFGIPQHVSWLPTASGESRKVVTVSPKEIVLALMQHGRLTVFAGRACDIEALRDHVGIRQNTVAWAEILRWGWPEGSPSKWNPKYWKAGTPRKRYPLWQAVNDAFFHQDKYEIGCYAAARLVLVGDGAFQMTGMELATVARYGLNPVVVVLNNFGYGTERHMQDGPYNDVWPWRYCKLPEVLGAGRGFLVRTEKELDEALNEAAKHTSSFCLLDVHLEKLDRSPALDRLASRLAKRI